MTQNMLVFSAKNTLTMVLCYWFCSLL